MNTVTKTQINSNYFEINAKEFEQAIKFLRKVNKSKSAVATLKADNSQMMLWTSTKDLSATAKLHGVVGNTQILTFNIETLAGFKSTDRHATLKFNLNRFDLDSLSVVAEPSYDLPDTNYYEEITVPSETTSLNTKHLIALTKSVIKSAGVTSNSPRDYGTQILFDQDQIVGTDGHRLSYAPIDLGQAFRFTLPVDTVKALESFSNPTTEVKINTSINKVSFSDGRYMVVTSPSNASYPSYKSVLPVVRGSVTVKNFSSELSELVKTVNKDAHYAVSLDVTKTQMTIKTPTANISLACSSSGEFSTTINGKYLLNVLKSSKDSSVTISTNVDNKNIVDVVTLTFSVFTTVIVTLAN